jgi:hypothetical protein
LVFGGHFALAAEVPNLNRQTTAEVAQGSNRDIAPWETAFAAGSDDHAAALVAPSGIRRSGPQKLLGSTRHLG